MSSISRKTKKIFLSATFVFVLAIGAAYSLKSYVFKQEAKKAPKTDSAENTGSGTTLAQEEICDEESDEYLFEKDREYFSAQVPEYIFAARSAYSVTFLNFSPFVWMIGDSPRYMEQVSREERDKIVEEKGIEGMPVITHQEAVGLYGKEKLQEWRILINGNFNEGGE
ncbi:MAG TPA: hypothetical protein DCX32_02815 [Candidatus Moranbacteria bacterium]|nr:MAG: hypothetical protein UW95_C0023G0023 [Parcubacteria group bacterium GW2011_GWC1_45_14]HAV11451.1 hypothetical protein [Candidatus Moranbacteria bacterium]